MCRAEPGLCVCRGDPHCFAFDATKYEREDELFLTGSCRYTLAQDDCYPSHQPATFRVIANFKRVKATVMRSFVSDVRVEYVVQGNVSIC